MTLSRNFLNGYWIGLFIFILANGLAAPLLSDFGLSAHLKPRARADDKSRAGFRFKRASG